MVGNEVSNSLVDHPREDNEAQALLNGSPSPYPALDKLFALPTQFLHRYGFTEHKTASILAPNLV